MHKSIALWIVLFGTCCSGSIPQDDQSRIDPQCKQKTATTTDTHYGVVIDVVCEE